MHRLAPHSLLALLFASLVPAAATAENIDLLMSNLFPKEELTYIGFDSVERADIPTASGVDRKYLIVDFRSGYGRDREQELASVHRVCTALLKNRDLIRSLTHQGYDMVSVAFDRHYQYDCL
ncbi:hypothetical protein SAMN05216203_3318 [Marinobacter daqiaonensis]|uniref:Uncharacterized protein n=1 Tax=Marinobacter daqiaonensis TaxID=650891 RepID=A0A1I6JUB0_9GAMM|nr:hypothetical protein [Marinobacter daqiaonensis]SFR82595.1 hypothetical protein SAMN05216203_3318 [Marinobacter daqiaonensis]